MQIVMPTCNVLTYISGLVIGYKHKSTLSVLDVPMFVDIILLYCSFWNLPMLCLARLLRVKSCCQCVCHLHIMRMQFY